MIQQEYHKIQDLLEAWQFIVVLTIIQDTHIVPIQMVSNEDMILALAGQFKQLSREPEKFR